MYNSAREASAGARILVVKLGAMGDIIHALPAVASLKHSFPGSRIAWAVAPEWAALLDGNVFIDRLIPVDRGSAAGLIHTARELRRDRFDFAVDFQGLVKSAFVASVARVDRIFGFHRTEVRERPAALFYSNAVTSHSSHKVDRNLDLARAAGATALIQSFPLPDGVAEGASPDGEFVLASPLAGWKSKQWPLEYYSHLAARLDRELGIPMVVNGPPGSEDILARIDGARRHVSSVAGLIHATRRASAVVGVDSGPMHLAAALGKAGVAIFGPTDPEFHGPYGNSLVVLRNARAVTTYKRRSTIDQSMRALSPREVFEVLEGQLNRRTQSLPA